MSPLRRSVTERSPSCTGSTVYDGLSTRFGFWSTPNSFSTLASAAASSNLPETTSTALSGW